MGRSRGKGDKRVKDSKGDLKDDAAREKKPSVFERLSSPRDNVGEERSTAREEARPREREKKVDIDGGSKRRGDASDKEADRPRKRPAIVWEPRPVRGDEQQDNTASKELQAKEREAPLKEAPMKESTAATDRAMGNSSERSKPESDEGPDRKEKDSRREARSDKAREKEAHASKSREDERGGKPATASSSGREQRDKGDKAEKDVSGTKDKERGKGEKSSTGGNEKDKPRQDVNDGPGGPSSSRREADKERDRDKERETKDREKERYKDREKERDREYDDRAGSRHDREHESKEREERGTRDRDKEAGDRDRWRERDRERDRRSERDKMERDLDIHVRDRVIDMPAITPFADGRPSDHPLGSPPQGMPMPNITRPPGPPMMMHASKDFQPPPPPPPRQSEAFGYGSQGMHHSDRSITGDVGGGNAMGMGQQHSDHVAGGGGGGGGSFRPFGPMVSVRAGFDGSSGRGLRGGRTFYDEHPDDNARSSHPMPPLTGVQMPSSFTPDPSTTYLDGGGRMSPQHEPGQGMRTLGGDGGSRHNGSGPAGQQPLMMPPIMDMGRTGGSGMGMTMVQQPQQQQQQQQPQRMMGNMGSGGTGPTGPEAGMASEVMISGMESGGGARRGQLPPGTQRGGDQAAHGHGGQAQGYASSAYAFGVSAAVGGSGSHQHQQQVPQPAAAPKDPLLQMKIRRELCRQRAQLEEVMACAQVVGQEAYEEYEKALKRIGAEVVLLPLEAQPSIVTEPRPAVLSGTSTNVTSGSNLSARIRRFALSELLLDESYWSAAHMAATVAAASAAGLGAGARSSLLGIGSGEHHQAHSQGLQLCKLAQESYSKMPWCRFGKGGVFFLTEAQQAQGLF